MTRFLGCHVSAAGGLEFALRNAKALGANAIQLHPSPPQRWTYKPFAPGVEEQFLKARADSGVKKVFFHGIYLINLATPDPQKLGLAKKSLTYYLDLIQRVQGDGVIFHVGSLKDQSDEQVGLTQCSETINQILSDARDGGTLLLEVAAGSGKVIGARMEQLATIYSKIEQKDRVGFALDTQHLWASGYDLQNRLEEILGEVKQYFTLPKVRAIHLNDSKTELTSKKDRHENLGDGLIGEAALSAFLNHPDLIEIPFILETPDLGEIETAKGQMEKLLRMAKG